MSFIPKNYNTYLIEKLEKGIKTRCPIKNEKFKPYKTSIFTKSDRQFPSLRVWDNYYLRSLFNTSQFKAENVEGTALEEDTRFSKDLWQKDF